MTASWTHQVPQDMIQFSVMMCLLKTRKQRSEKSVFCHSTFHFWITWMELIRLLTGQYDCSSSCGRGKICEVGAVMLMNRSISERSLADSLFILVWYGQQQIKWKGNKCCYWSSVMILILFHDHKLSVKMYCNWDHLYYISFYSGVISWNSYLKIQKSMHFVDNQWQKCSAQLQQNSFITVKWAQMNNHV
jgi:hypothetical protein